MNNIQRFLFIIIIAAMVTCLLVYQCTRISNLGYHHKTHTILYWTPMFDQHDFNLGLGEDIFKECSYKNCLATANRNLHPVDQFDAILFHGIEYDYFDKPQNRSPHQVYVFSNQESPMYTPPLIRCPEGFYNWTMTYRLDSDILRPYGFFEEASGEYQPPSAAEMRNKTKLIAWMVSNCGSASKRDLLYEKIKSYIPVDVFGVCGNKSCPKSKSEECYNMIETNYKFYLSFENSLCEDYITEKLYNVLKKNIVPVVYGSADYNRLAPPHSVINVADFDNVKELVDYLWFLHMNTEEYLQYFEWKKQYRVNTGNKLVLCALCEKLNKPTTSKIYKNIGKWWSGQNLSKCNTF